MLGIIITTAIFIGALVGFQKLLDTQEIKNNWPKYRCRPDVMLMADFYGHNSSENFEYCLANGFQERAKQALGPFYTYLGKFVQILMTLLKSINSIYLTFATIVGSITTVFTEFSQRIQAFFYRVQNTMIRIKFLMNRVFATMFAVIFMGMSGIKAATNFGNTFLFKFLDTFCFDPDTYVYIKGRGTVRVKDVDIGDVFSSGEKVTAKFDFFADGQPMVKFVDSDYHPIVVSTNHYLLHNGKWIQAKDHPSAIPADDWNGGIERPLICFNTDKHTFSIGKFVFRDYDESEEGDQETMKTVDKQLNNKDTSFTPLTYNTTVHPMIYIRTKSGSIPAKDIQLGTELLNGNVVGIVKKECSRVFFNGLDCFGEGTCIWSEKENKWIRPKAEMVFKQPSIFYSFVVTPSACIETEQGTVIRDYVEIHSPDTEKAYANVLDKLQ